MKNAFKRVQICLVREIDVKIVRNLRIKANKLLLSKPVPAFYKCYNLTRLTAIQNWLYLAVMVGG